MKSDLLYVEHILECIRRIDEYTGGRGSAAQQVFRRSSLVQDAVIRNLQVLAESASRISAEHQALEPDVPWQQVRAFRNVLVHQYLGIDLEFVWSIVVEDLPLPEEKAAQLRDHLISAN
ncbi:MAG TPA: HepT-like ribonuclease domain-containing protein [Bryobacteraceae bacterium]|jgi:uncharacterized protein with HEPN domain